MKSLEEQEEEVAALVKRDVAGDGQAEDPEQQQQMEGDDDAAHNTRPRPPPATTTTKQQTRESSWWRWRAQKLMPTSRGRGRGVGLVIAGLLLLALLVATSTTTSTWRIHLDYASSFLLGGGVKQQQQQQQQQQRWRPHHVASPEAELVPIPFSCGNGTAGSSSAPGTCRRRDAATATTTAHVSSPSPSPSESQSSSSSALKKPPPADHECPEYFRFIHSDLSPWRSTGITRETVERGRDRAAFRLVVLAGRAYVETYHRVFQTRDTFTQWGIAQLLARYPGRVPDLDLMFNCEDMPEVKKKRPEEQPPPPPLFRYCKDDSTVDVVFPDWSFWGWPEVNIRPWAPLLEEMAAETARLPWSDRQPYAFWKGNPSVHGERADLLRCNDTAGEWRTRVFWQDWGAAARRGFAGSNLARQCRYRYKIFVRGRSWSVSEKYILACDSPVLLVDTPFKDFFSRGLVAGKHYWPIDAGGGKCESIRFAVDWGNAHPEQARRMAEEGSGFARHHLSMDYVYDYMLHLLTEYAALLRYTPTVPENAVELCAEAVACPAAASGNSDSREFRFMMESMERYVADFQPCTLPPPFTDDEIRDMARREQEVRDNIHRMMAASSTKTHS